MIEPRKQLSANKWNQFLADAELRWHLPAAALVDVTDPHQLATKLANELRTSNARMEREVHNLLADFVAKLRLAV